MKTLLTLLSLIIGGAGAYTISERDAIDAVEATATVERTVKQRHADQYAEIQKLLGQGTEIGMPSYEHTK